MEVIKQDANKIIEKLNNEWAGDMVNSKKRIAFLLAENEQLKSENSVLKNRNEELRNQLKEEEKETDE